MVGHGGPASDVRTWPSAERRCSVTTTGETEGGLAAESRPPDPNACYERRYTDSWAKETLGPVICWLDGNVVKLQSSCRRCGHQLDGFFVIREALATTISANGGLKRMDHLDAGLDPLTFADVLACNCESEHHGRPADKRGRLVRRA
jgi:hypothetical protein